jgi:hypothetical protein
MATKNPSRSGPEGFADLSIVARIFIRKELLRMGSAARY